MALNTDSEIKTYALHVMVKDIYKEINSLMLDCIENDTVPYVQDKPLPQDMNIVNGRHLGDINKIQLELKASQIGAKSLKWIYGADAALLGLELKNKQNSPEEFQKSKDASPNFNTEPIIGLANVRRNTASVTNGISNIADIAAEGIKTNAQTIYLLDQFTEKSVERALKQSRIEEKLEMRGNPETQKMKRIIAQNMIKNISEYDTGLNEMELRENKRKNIAKNLKDPNTLKEVSQSFQNVTKGYDKPQKFIFSALNNYYVKQETGLNLNKPMSPEQKSYLLKSLDEIVKADSPRLAQTLSESFFYSERLTQFDFSHERIYSQSEKDKKLNVLAPRAARFEPKNIGTLANDKNIELLRERNREFKPRQITHSRGL